MEVYRSWDKHWNRNGTSPTPTYRGQQPIRYPESWAPLQCFLAAHPRPTA